MARTLYRFVGTADQWVPGIPARDLTDDDIETLRADGIDVDGLDDSPLYAGPRSEEAREAEPLPEPEPELDRVARALEEQSSSRVSVADRMAELYPPETVEEELVEPPPARSTRRGRAAAEESAQQAGGEG